MIGKNYIVEVDLASLSFIDVVTICVVHGVEDEASQIERNIIEVHAVDPVKNNMYFLDL